MKIIKRSDYYTCPCCGSNLDPGEKCDCMKREVAKHERNKNSRNKS